MSASWINAILCHAMSHVTWFFKFFLLFLGFCCVFLKYFEYCLCCFILQACRAINYDSFNALETRVHIFFPFHSYMRIYVHMYVYMCKWLLACPPMCCGYLLLFVVCTIYCLFICSNQRCVETEKRKQAQNPKSLRQLPFYLICAIAHLGVISIIHDRFVSTHCLNQLYQHSIATNTLNTITNCWRRRSSLPPTLFAFSSFVKYIRLRL